MYTLRMVDMINSYDWSKRKRKKEKGGKKYPDNPGYTISSGVSSRINKTEWDEDDGHAQVLVQLPLSLSIALHVVTILYTV